MGNYHILDHHANDITQSDEWHTIQTHNLPESVSLKSIHLSELLHKAERLDVILPLTDVLLPSGLLAETLTLINNRSSRIGLWADTSISTDQLDTLLTARDDADNSLLHSLDLIVLFQPAFVDGRTFSQARHLRQQGFKGEIRVAGEFGLDQIAYLKRTGINSFVIAAEELTEDVNTTFHALASSYDGSQASQLPMFR